jgi:hypothetical protein
MPKTDFAILIPGIIYISIVERNISLDFATQHSSLVQTSVSGFLFHLAKTSIFRFQYQIQPL